MMPSPAPLLLLFSLALSFPAATLASPTEWAVDSGYNQVKIFSNAVMFKITLIISIACKHLKHVKLISSNAFVPTMKDVPVIDLTGNVAVGQSIRAAEAGDDDRVADITVPVRND